VPKRDNWREDEWKAYQAKYPILNPDYSPGNDELRVPVGTAGAEYSAEYFGLIQKAIAEKKGIYAYY
jgi:hypothetical protein